MDSVRDEIRSVVIDVLDKGPEDKKASWQACADAGLLGLAAPEEYAGEGLGLGEIGVLLHELGTRAIDLPVWDTLACGLMTLVRAGTPEQQGRYIPDVVAGKLLLAPAICEPGAALLDVPRTRLVDGRVTGHKTGVTDLDGSLLLVTTDGGVAIVDPAGPGVTRTPSYASRGRSETGYVLDGAPALEVLPAEADDVLREHAVAGLLLLGAGLLAGARDLTAGYIKQRTQFGRTLAEFQAVAVQIADVYVASRMTALAADSAAWRVH